MEIFGAPTNLLFFPKFRFLHFNLFEFRFSLFTLTRGRSTVFYLFLTRVFDCRWFLRVSTRSRSTLCWQNLLNGLTPDVQKSFGNCLTLCFRVIDKFFWRLRQRFGRLVWMAALLERACSECLWSDVRGGGNQITISAVIIVPIPWKSEGSQVTYW